MSSKVLQHPPSDFVKLFYPTKRFQLIAGKFSGHIPSLLFLEFTIRWPAFKAIQVMSM